MTNFIDAIKKLFTLDGTYVKYQEKGTGSQEMESQNCCYNHKGIACPLAGSIKMNHHHGWFCYIHAKNVPVGKEEFILQWIKSNQEQIEKARRQPYLFDRPPLPLNYYSLSPRKKIISKEEMPF